MRTRRKPPTKITERHIEFIRQNSLRLLQSELALELKISDSCVRRIQKRENIPHFTRQAGRALRYAERELPPWLPACLEDDYRKRGRRQGYISATRWAYKAKQRLSP